MSKQSGAHSLDGNCRIDYGACAQSQGTNCGRQEGRAESASLSFVSPNLDKAEKRQPRWPRLRQNLGVKSFVHADTPPRSLAAQPAGNHISWW